MYLQRILMPNGKVSWTAFDDGGSPVLEIREFVLYLEARHYAPSTIKHYAKHVVRLGNYLGAFGKSFTGLTAPEYDRYVRAVVQHGDQLDADMALNIIPLRQDRVEVSASLYNQILFAVKGFYQFLDLRLASAVFGEADRKPGYDAPDAYRPFLQHISARKARRNTERRADKKAKAAAAKRAADSRLLPEEVFRIIQAATLARDAFLVVILYTTGMRIGEARGLLHEDFRLDENVIWVTPRELENGARVKSGKARPIPVPEFVMRMYEDFIASDEYLEAFESGTDFVFCNIRAGRIGRGLTEDSAYGIQDRLVQRSGVDFTWHIFRHSHASEAIGQGYSLLDVADRLGHASPQTTNSIYKHLFNAEYRKLRLRSHDELEGSLDKLRREGLTEEQKKWL
jgi:integrase/recombinase XerD